ncbi:MarR family transcriptional regulator [Allobacillus sp. SKP2-8]|uniref:MarR family winged helix-turn-helix transcriptional regulator n=1 Tax=unclassified Allobacillus TaxID=2628859 RepID=UPI0011841B1E|nr:MarR family transcriptional regulator [Allobacillus sp. SKP2-8]
MNLRDTKEVIRLAEERDEGLSLKLFIVLTRALDAIQKRVIEDIKHLGLNPTEFAVLELIYNKGDQPIQKIGEKVLIASSSITYVVDQLEKKELLERKLHPSDRRVKLATITQKGKTLMDDVFPTHKKGLQEIFAGLDVEEKEQLIEQLKKLGLHAQNLN